MFAHVVLSFSLLGLTPPADCGPVKDEDKRPFDERSPVTLDVDGDGKLDTIAPRTYTVKAGRQMSGEGGRKTREARWISFDLKTSQGRRLKSFFKYQYGTEESEYWVYAVVPCDVNDDGRADLVFYTGDDTSDETIILLNTGKTFKVYSSETRFYS